MNPYLPPNSTLLADRPGLRHPWPWMLRTCIASLSCAPLYLAALSSLDRSPVWAWLDPAWAAGTVVLAVVAPACWILLPALREPMGFRRLDGMTVSGVAATFVAAVISLAYAFSVAMGFVLDHS